MNKLRCALDLLSCWNSLDQSNLASALPQLKSSFASLLDELNKRLGLEDAGRTDSGRFNGLIDPFFFPAFKSFLVALSLVYKMDVPKQNFISEFLRDIRSYLYKWDSTEAEKIYAIVFKESASSNPLMEEGARKIRILWDFLENCPEYSLSHLPAVPQETITYLYTTEHGFLNANFLVNNIHTTMNRIVSVRPDAVSDPSVMGVYFSVKRIKTSDMERSHQWMSLIEQNDGFELKRELSHEQKTSHSALYAPIESLLRDLISTALSTIELHKRSSVSTLPIEIFVILQQPKDSSYGGSFSSIVTPLKDLMDEYVYVFLSNILSSEDSLSSQSSGNDYIAQPSLEESQLRMSRISITPGDITQETLNRMHELFEQLRKLVTEPRAFFIKCEACVKEIKKVTTQNSQFKSHLLSQYINEVFTRFLHLSAIVRSSNQGSEGRRTTQIECIDGALLFEELFDIALYSPKQRERIKTEISELRQLTKEKETAVHESKASKKIDNISNRFFMEITGINRVKSELAIKSKLEHIKLNEMDKKIRSYASEKIESAVKSLWPESTIEFFGSYAMGISSKTSDIDICIHLPSERSAPEPIDNLKELRDILKRDGTWTKVSLIPSQHSPVLTLVYEQSGVSLDIVINRKHNKEKTKIIQAFISANPKLVDFILLLKDWAKRHNINDASRGSLNSLSYVILAIVHFQSRPTPALPVLPLPYRPEEATQSLLVDIARKAEKFVHHNDESLSMLLASFFYFYGYKFNHETECVSIHSGAIIPKPEAHMWERRGDIHFCICDPINGRDNVGRSVQLRGAKDITATFRSGYEELVKSGRF